MLQKELIWIFKLFKKNYQKCILLKLGFLIKKYKEHLTKPIIP